MVTSEPDKSIQKDDGAQPKASSPTPTAPDRADGADAGGASGANKKAANTSTSDAKPKPASSDTAPFPSVTPQSLLQEVQALHQPKLPN